MDIHEALYTTRAMRRLRPDPIPLDAQARIVDAAVRAPSGGNQQGWRFLLVDDPAIKSRLAAFYLTGWERALADRYANQSSSGGQQARVLRSADHLARHFAEVPLFLIGLGRGSGASSLYPALWSAMLAARAEGVGSTLTTILGERHDDVLELLGVPAGEGWRMHGCIALGYPTGRWGVARRVPAHEVTYRNGWGQPPGFTADAPLWPPPR
jgi:nitroreductase